jgi:hypothetical protein
MTNSRMTNDAGMTKPENALDYEAHFWSNGDMAAVGEEPTFLRHSSFAIRHFFVRHFPHA